MSEGIESRLRNHAEKTPDEMACVYAGDVIEVIDYLKAQLAERDEQLAAAEKERDEAKRQHRLVRILLDDIEEVKNEFRAENTAATARAEAAEKRAESLAELLRLAIERMDRARNIITCGNPAWSLNWGMLDTRDLLAQQEGGSDGK